MLNLDNPPPQLQPNPNPEGDSLENKYSAILRDHSRLNDRPTLHIDSEDFDLLCLAIKQQVISPFLGNRMKIYLEKCCWGFSKASTLKNTKNPHETRLCLNSHFPPKITDQEILPAIKSLLLSVGKEVGRLQKGFLQVPFVNLPHMHSSPAVIPLLASKVSEELEFLKKRDLCFFEATHLIVSDIEKCQRRIRKTRVNLIYQESLLKSIDNGLNNLIADLNRKLVGYDDRVHSLEKDNKELKSRLVEVEMELSYHRSQLHPRQH
jgi:hypothetical protein